MAMSARRYAALQNMAAMGSGPEAETAARKLAGQSVGARVPVVPRTSGTMRGSIGGGVRAGTPARLPVRGAIGSGSGRNLPVLYRGGAPAVRAASAPAVAPAVRSAASKSAPSANVATKGMKMSKKSLLGIGLGMGVAAGVAMNRRGEGASSGRQSMYKY